ncbi:hypothetical protein VTP01DRAFT_7690 [Rhizomucor pusillus]|uniref:uncharacterized protein n=1 Tax=Rhizomucor pusillus TaxID=4840 RepID=UPI00374349E1
MGSDRKGRDSKRRDRKRDAHDGESTKPFLQSPVILERKDRPAVTTSERPSNRAASESTPILLESRSKTASLRTASSSESNAVNKNPVPFYRRFGRVNSEACLKILSEHPGHFVVGIIGRQGAGKSTLLSCLMGEESKETRPTIGIDLSISPERIILLDTEPLLSTSMIEDALRSGSFDGMPPDLWCEVQALYDTIFLLSACNVLIVVTEGTEADLEVLDLLKRAEMLHLNVSEHPASVTTASNMDQDVDMLPYIVFVHNKCEPWEFDAKNYANLQQRIAAFFAKSKLKTSDLVGRASILPWHSATNPLERQNVFLLPRRDAKDEVLAFEFDTFINELYKDIVTASRKPGKLGQISERDWFRNASKYLDSVQKADHIASYIRILRKIAES